MIEKLWLLLKTWFLKKPQAFVPLVLFAVLLLSVGIFALTQEPADTEIQGELGELSGEIDSGFFDGDFPDGEFLPEWAPPGPARWFRSNAGGMALEENPSRLSALRNKFALVVDYVPPDEIEPRLARFFQDGFSVEIHVLYEEGREYRRQWLFLDEDGNVRLNAVFKPLNEDVAEDEAIGEESAGESSDVTSADAASPDSEETEFEFSGEEINGEDPALADELIEGEIALAEAGAFSDEGSPSIEGAPVTDVEIIEEAPPAAVLNKEALISIGFIELYNEKKQIAEDRWLFEDDNEIITTYFYVQNVLVRAETWEIVSAASPVKVYTDTYRYNRAFSLRNVERRYHEMADAQPVLLSFPYRVLRAASNDDFISEKLHLNFDFLGNFTVGEGFRMTYETDSRGRILTQTLLDNKEQIVWVINNTWAGDRIVSVLKTEGEDKKLTEFEYDSGGKRIVQRDMNNGVLERQVITSGDTETEELFMNGVVVLRAYWEDGRKIREERVRRQ